MSKEAQQALDFLASCPGGTTTLERRDVHELLLQTGGDMMACGSLYDIKAKNIGAGVYRLSLSRRNP